MIIRHLSQGYICVPSTTLPPPLCLLLPILPTSVFFWGRGCCQGNCHGCDTMAGAPRNCERSSDREQKGWGGGMFIRCPHVLQHWRGGVGSRLSTDSLGHARGGRERETERVGSRMALIKGLHNLSPGVNFLRLFHVSKEISVYWRRLVSAGCFIFDRLWTKWERQEHGNVMSEEEFLPKASSSHNSCSSSLQPSIPHRHMTDELHVWRRYGNKS